MSWGIVRIGTLLATLAIGAAVLSGCGESKEEKAAKSVCSSVSTIDAELAKLQSPTLSATLPEEVRNSVNAISSGIKSIKEQAPNLEQARRTEIEAANKIFATELAVTGASILSAATAGNAKSALESAAGKVKTAATNAATAYKQAFKALNCS